MPPSFLDYPSVFRRLALVLVAALVFCPAGTAPRARAADFSEYEVKANFLAKFADFVDWPSGATTVVIGVLGDDPFGGSLDKAVQGQTVAGRPVMIKRSHRLEDLRTCQVLFVTKSERGRAGEVLAAVQGAPVLTVGDFEQFTKEGGVIAFVLTEGKVRFEVNAGAAKQTGLKISSRLLKYSRP